jgi:FkbM family methyltransferase
MAFIFEIKKHPWEYVFDYMTISAQQRYSKTNYYIQKYFSVNIKNNDYYLQKGDFKIIIPEYFFKKESFMLGFLSVYFDIIYPTQTKYPIPCIVIEGNYEKYGVQIEKNDYVIDAGANIGEFSIYASQKVGLKGKILAFEPIPDIYKILTNQRKVMKYDNMIGIKEALDQYEGKTRFKYSEDYTGGSSETKLNEESIEVKVNTIDNYVKTNKIDKINFIKMDIEGAERHALTGAVETIKKYKPKLSICIYHLKDDPVIIKNIITGIRPDYKYKMTDWKIYAW